MSTPTTLKLLRVLAVPLLLANCASYKPSSGPISSPATATAEIEADGLFLRADPYTDSERQKKVFDADFNKAGILALEISVRNDTERRQLVRRSDMTLVLPNGRPVSPAGVSTVVTQLQDSGAVIGATVMFGIVGLLAASSAEDTARSARLADYQNKAFEDTTLAKQDVARGFVFFVPAKSTQPFNDAALKVRFVDADEGTGRVVEAPLHALGFTGMTEKKPNCGPGFQSGPECR